LPSSFLMLTCLGKMIAVGVVIRLQNGLITVFEFGCKKLRWILRIKLSL